MPNENSTRELDDSGSQFFCSPCERQIPWPRRSYGLQQGTTAAFLIRFAARRNSAILPGLKPNC
jgi:hypothetical protein